MAYQEVSSVEIQEVLRHWQGGGSQRALTRPGGRRLNNGVLWALGSGDRWRDSSMPCCLSNYRLIRRPSVSDYGLEEFLPNPRKPEL